MEKLEKRTNSCKSAPTHLDPMDKNLSAKDLSGARKSNLDFGNLSGLFGKQKTPETTTSIHFDLTKLDGSRRTSSTSNGKSPRSPHNNTSSCPTPSSHRQSPRRLTGDFSVDSVFGTTDLIRKTSDFDFGNLDDLFLSKQYSQYDLEELFLNGPFKELKVTLDASTNVIPFKEIFEHNTKESCWVVINEAVYDLTTFLHHHPNGFESVLKFAGTDITSTFQKSHSLHEQMLDRMSVFRIGIIEQNLQYKFEDCMNEELPVHAAFSRFLQDVRSSEQLECVVAIHEFEKNHGTVEGQNMCTFILESFIVKESPNEVNIDHQTREQLCAGATDPTSVPVNYFAKLEAMLKFQLKQDLYDLFLISHSFKVWMITHRMQNDLINSMDTILNNFHKMGFDEDVQVKGPTKTPTTGKTTLKGLFGMFSRTKTNK
jgi:cytochrome b involved in lipid metabolism